MFVLGTAGHVDHGKSALLRCLTGMEPDRLPEEKKRGMTIDLNFVWTETSRGTVGIVDVPGHKRLVKNTITGVVQVDAFLFVVAADDGWMPQSEEHLEVLESMGVTDGIAIISKSDLVSPERWQEVAKDVGERLESRFHRKIPTLRFSALEGEGVTQIREGLDGLLQRLPDPEVHGHSRVWVDRIFTPRGAGVVVTGTLRQAPLKVGDSLQMWPSGKSALVKGIETYHKRVEEAGPVSRVALQLGQVAAQDLKRGTLLSSDPQTLTSRADVKIHFFGKPIRRNTELGFYLGTMEEKCLFIPLGKAGGSLARLRFSRPLPLRFGDRFLLRLSGKERTVAGGVVLDARSRSRTHLLAEKALADAEPTLKTYLALETAFSGLLEPEQLDRDSIFTSAQIAQALSANSAYRRVKSTFVLTAQYEKITSLFKSLLQKDVVSEKTLAKRLKEEGYSVGWLPLVLDEILAAKPKSAPTLTAAEKAILDPLLKTKTPTKHSELIAAGASKEAVEKWARENHLVRLPEQYFLHSQMYEAYLKRVKEYLLQKEKATTGELKDLLGLSRKHAALVLEKMDGDRHTYLKDSVRRLLRE